MSTESPTDWSLLSTGLSRSTKTVVVLDLVESVRLMEQHEADIVHRWQAVQRTVGQLLVQHHGRLVKSLGDGMMLEFDQPQTAAQCALAVQAAMPGFNLGYEVDRHLMLRIGLHTAQVYADAMDIYGSGVNLAARITTLAGPGEVVASAEVRDALTDGLDGTLEDLGECYLKHVKEPVRVYRVGGAGPDSVLPPSKEYDVPLQPTIAVIPFEARSNEPEPFAIGELIADGVIAQLSRTPELRVISRLSTSALKGRTVRADQLIDHLGATYVLSGSYVEVNGDLLLNAELSHTVSECVVWAERSKGHVRELLQLNNETLGHIAARVHEAIIDTEVKKALTHPLPTLQSVTILLGAVNGIMSSGKSGFQRPREMLEYLVQKHSRNAAPHAWLAYWHSRNITQGWSQDLQHDRQKAISAAARAVDADSNSAIALTINGLVEAHHVHDLDSAERSYSKALELNPNDALAWLNLGVVWAFKDEGRKALDASERALKLSPLDPQAYFFDSLAAAAAIAAGEYSRAIALAIKSLQLNCTFTSTYRTLAVAQVRNNAVLDARQTVRRLLEIDPGYSVEKFLQRSPSVRFGKGSEFARDLALAGLPSK